MAALVGLSMFCCSAWATTGHSYTDQFGAPGNGNGEFSGGPLGIGVLQGSGDVFAVDPGHVDGGGAPDPRVERFNGSGGFVSAFSIDSSLSYGLGYPPSGLAVDSGGSGAVYVSATDPNSSGGVVLKYSTAGSLLYRLDPGSSVAINAGAPVAVDPVDGSVYATATLTDGSGAQVVAVFDGSTGAFESSFAGGSPDGGFVCPQGLAVDSAHRVYVLDRGAACFFYAGRVEQYTAAGTYEQTLQEGSSNVSGVAVDPASGEVYVVGSGPIGLQVTTFSAGGTTMGQRFDASNVASLAGIAVDSASGTVFTADNANAVVQRFTAFAGPTVTTTAASSIGAGSATLNGTIDPEGIASSYHFEWGTDATYGNIAPVPDTSVGAGNSPVAASVTIPDLRPNSTYHYRIIGSNASGPIAGDDEEVTTAPIAPTVDGPPSVTEITSNAANVHATVNPGHSPTSFRVEYGTSAAYGTITAPESAGSADGPVPVAKTLDGLEPGTQYHYRVIADNGVGGSVNGTDGTFFTAPATPAAATGLTTTKATLTGTVDPHGQATSYYFNYGPTPAFGASTEETDAGSGNGEQAVSEQITDLEPGTTYHVQVVATTNGVTRTGAAGTFTTPPAPIASASEVTAVTTSSATLAGTTDAHGLAGSYRFELWSLDSDYSVDTGDKPTPMGAGAHPVTAALSGLPAGETFVVHLIVSSNDSTDYSDQVSFATPALPRIFPPPPTQAALYGCGSPVLSAFNSHPKPGDTIQISGKDLGTGGSVSLGDRSLTPENWSPSGFSVDIPADASGSLPLTIDCGQRSNTIAIAIFKAPNNSFTIVKRVVARDTASLSIKVPGPGKVQTTGGRTRAVTTTIARPGTKTVKVKLTANGAKALKSAKGGKLRTTLSVKFTPVGGQPSTKTTIVTFHRKAGARS